MKYRVYTRMEFCKEIEADSREEAWLIAEDLDYEWADCYEQEISMVTEV